uniref:Protein kinase domain-containing protein n=1 Tax=Zooxanthella nutricula TaxID=1333877 RepID=A0A7S2M7N5_9DINO
MPLDGLDLETSCYLVQGTKFEVDKRYKIVEPMSHGAYGIVCSAEDKEVGERVAVKKIEGVFEHITITKRTLRELRILRHLQHENLMQVKNIFITGKKTEFEEIYVVSELMETDLATTLRSSQPLSDDHRQFFLYQILRGMKYVHSAQVIHRDLKPRNLLVNSNCDLKICDFGLARVRFSDKGWVCPMTEYVCTRWYRAPEVLCSWTDYSCAIDIWSIGCILAEMHMRKPLYPGHNTQQQLDLIIGLLGSPDGEELMKIPNGKCRKFIKSLPRTPGKPFGEVFQDMSPLAQEVLAMTMRWDPEGRISVNEALVHPYMEKLHCPEDEPIREPLDTLDFEFERRKINVAALREEIFRETLWYYPDLFDQFHRELRESDPHHDIFGYRLLVPGESQYSSDDDANDD